MWIADGWKEYEVIDTSCGEKLERWGDYLLVRPDPQVIWDTPKVYKGWKHMNGHYHRSKKGGGEWEFFDLPEQWDIHYKDLTFHLKPFSFKHTGLFPEQATNWDWFGDKIRHAGRPVKVLNLFAYTGGVLASAWDLRHFVMPRISLCISESACFRQSGTVQGSSHSELPCELPLVSLLQIVPENVRNCKNGHIGRWPNAVRRRY